MLFAVINPAILLGLRPVLTHSPPVLSPVKVFCAAGWRSVDVIALSPIGVRVIGDEPFISLHEFTHDPKRAFDIDFWAFDIDF